MVSNKQRFEWNQFIWYDAFEIYIPDTKPHTLTMLMRESGTAVDLIMLREFATHGKELPEEP